MGSEQRQKTKYITIRVTESEKEVIEKNASLHLIPVSQYGRLLMLNHTPTSKTDALVIDELADLNAQLGRIGGLLKMWLGNKELSDYGKDLNVPSLLHSLNERQRELQKKVIEL